MIESAPAADALDTTLVSGDPLRGTPYRAVAPLGKGGMGEVLEAEHMELERRVVVKLLLSELAGDPRILDRCRVEARTLALLDHPNIVKVIDFGHTPEGRAYLVMERLVGRTLREELRERGALPAVEAIGLVRQVLAGLAAAHRLAVVHRDIKPDNIFVCRPPRDEPPIVKVLDFGVAKILRAAGRRDGSMPRYSTQDGVIVGTPRCVAPEQVTRGAVDSRVDIYAAGLLLYTLIVGHGPFAHAETALDVLNAHVIEPPVPPSQVARQPIPIELDMAILKALAKHPEERFQTAEEFGWELARAASIAAELDEEQPLVTERGTLIMPRPAALSAPSGPAVRATPCGCPVAPASRGHLESDRALSHLPLNLAPPAGGSPWWLFIGLTFASAMAFAALFLLAYRFW